MTLALEVVFWASLTVPVAVYLGYPFVLRGLARVVVPRPLAAVEPWPSVTVTIAAHNEERDIERAVRSCLAQPYAGPPPTILVGLDGCTDGTRAVLDSIGDPRVSYLDLERAGKAATDNRLVAAAMTDVIVTTAAGAELGPGTLERLCAPFRDPGVGCVTGVFAPRQDGSSTARGEGGYWRSEQALMGAEARLGMLATASGTCMSHRRAIFLPIPLDSDGDVAVAPNAVLAGMRVVFEPQAVVYDDGPPNLEAVLGNRRRMALRALPTTVTFIARLLASGRFRVAIGLVFHKLLRWLVPFAGIAWLMAAAALAVRGDVAYARFGLVLVAGGLAAGLALWIAGGRYRGLASSFLVAQVSFALATLDALAGRRASMWTRPPGAASG